MKILAIFLLAILTILAVACSNSDEPTKPDVVKYAYEGTFISDSGRDLQGFEWQFEFVAACNDYVTGKLPSDEVMRAELECKPETAHEVRLFTAIYNPSDPGPYASFSNISWQPNAKGDKYTFVFHVK